MIVVEKTTNQANEYQTVFVELSFEISGEMLPADHGYGLYSAIAHLCPLVHEQEGVSISTISGEPDHQGKIYFSKNAHLKIRALLNQGMEVDY